MAQNVTSVVGVSVSQARWKIAMAALLADPALELEAGLLDTDSQIAEYGTYNELGTKDIPARPFVSSSFDDNRRDYERILQNGLRAAERGKPLRSTLTLLGIRMTNDIKKRITSLRSPPNRPSTVAKKKSSNPLIDTGAMRNAVRWRIRKP